MAGESAREVARRQRAKAEQLLRSAEAFERGAEGEEATARALAALPANHWRVLHDVRWPGRRYANIDHVIVGPTGIFVIDSKHWSGSVEVRDQVLLQNGRRREKEVAAAADSALAVASSIPGLSPYLVTPVLCFVRDELIAGWARDVMVCSTSNIQAMLESRPPVFAQPEVHRQYAWLQYALHSATMDNPPQPVRRGWHAGKAGPSGPAMTMPVPTSAQAPPPRPIRMRPVPRRGRKPRNRVGSLVAAAFLLLFLMGAVQNGWIEALSNRFTNSLSIAPTIKAIGQPVTLEGSATTPRLQTTAMEVITLVPANTSVPPGQQLWGVRMKVQNTGTVPLGSPWPLRFSVTDDAGVAHVVETSVTKVKQRKVLTGDRPLAPGETATGVLPFELPATGRVARVHVRYGTELGMWKPTAAP